MKQFSKIMLLAQCFGLVAVVFFFTGSRAASPQATGTAAPTTRLIALTCQTFKSVGNKLLQCDHLFEWDTAGGLNPYTPQPGTALVVTDIECGMPASAGATSAESLNVYCSLGATPILTLEGTAAKDDRRVFVTMHLTSGITFTGFPGIYLTDAVYSGSVFVNLQGYIIQGTSGT